MFFERHWIPALRQAQGKLFAGMTVEDLEEPAGACRVEKVDKAKRSTLSTFQPFNFLNPLFTGSA
jgi:hypothetical protein